MKSIFVVVFVKLAADPDTLTKTVASWALAVLVIAVIVGTTYHGLRFLTGWLFNDGKKEE